jgi:hypothetical protein
MTSPQRLHFTVTQPTGAPDLEEKKLLTFLKKLMVGTSAGIMTSPRKL